MNRIVSLRALIDPSLAPCLVLVDLQQEYVAESRLMAVPEAGAALTKCRIALRHARAMGFPVAHFRQVCRSSFFNPTTTFGGWIDGFEPVGSDMIFDRDRPSCYSSRSFAELMETCGGHFVLAGFAGETACLSTSIDAFHRNHRFTYLHDASASHGLGDFAASTIQQATTEIIGVYGNVLDTESWINVTSEFTVLSGRVRHEQ